MPAFAWHLSIALDPARGSLDDPRVRRRFARTVLDCGEPFGLLAFRLHGSVLRGLVEGPKSTVADFARHLRICLEHRVGLSTDFRSVRIAPVAGAQQFYWQLLHVLRGPAQNLQDPLGDASNLHELLSLRSLATDCGERLIRLLPDLDPSHLEHLLPGGLRVPRPAPPRGAPRAGPERGGGVITGLAEPGRLVAPRPARRRGVVGA